MGTKVGVSGYMAYTSHFPYFMFYFCINCDVYQCQFVPAMMFFLYGKRYIISDGKGGKNLCRDMTVSSFFKPISVTRCQGHYKSEASERSHEN